MIAENACRFEEVQLPFNKRFDFADCSSQVCTHSDLVVYFFSFSCVINSRCHLESRIMKFMIHMVLYSSINSILLLLLLYIVEFKRWAIKICDKRNYIGGIDAFRSFSRILIVDILNLKSIIIHCII